MEGGTKKSEKQYRIFETHLPIVPVTVEFWSMSYFEGLKDKTNNPGY